MLRYIIFIILFVIFVYCRTNRVHIKFNTFLKRGYFVDNSPYGIYCYHNKQGSGKTQSAVTFLLDNTHYKIYANLKSIKGISYYYFSGWETLLKIGTEESDCIIFYDELFKGFYKGKKMSDKDKEVLMDFMSQMRKRHIIFITTCQEWLEIPIEFRRYVRFDIQCSLFSIFGYPILRKIFHNTELIKWDNLENEYVSPIIGTYIEHGRKKIVNSYDTFEQISKENIPPILTFNDYKGNILDEDKTLKLTNNNDLYDDKKSIVKNFVFEVPDSQELKNKKTIKKIFNFISNYVKKTTRFFTTTIKKRVVSCQFTNILPFKNKKNDISVNNDIDSVDKSFWNDINNNDLQ